MSKTLFVSLWNLCLFVINLMSDWQPRKSKSSSTCSAEQQEHQGLTLGLGLLQLCCRQQITRNKMVGVMWCPSYLFPHISCRIFSQIWASNISQDQLHESKILWYYWYHKWTLLGPLFPIPNTWHGQLESLSKQIFEDDFSEKTRSFFGGGWSRDENDQEEALSTEYTDIASHPAFTPP